jgi:1-acyl-sn-glycerol-3-phosphate acyltransferase
VLIARLRLASLWISQVARVLADWCLRVVALLGWANSAGSGNQTAWHVGTAVFITPFIVLAPLNGCLCNGLPRRGVLAGSAAFTLLVVVAFALAHWPWMICLGLVAIGAAVYSPARYAMLPAAAQDTHLPLPRVNGWIEMGGASAIVGGLALGWAIAAPEAVGPLAGQTVAVLLALNLLCFLTALPVAFPSDVRRPEPPLRAVAGFFRDCLRIGREAPAAVSLLGLATFQAIVTAGSGALVAQTLGSNQHEGFLQALALVGFGAALGCLTAGLQGHPERNLGLVPFGATGLLLALLWAGFAASPASPPVLPCFLLGFMGGWVNVPLRAAYLAAVPADARGNGMAVMNTVIYVLTTALAVLMVGLIQGGLLPTPLAQLCFLAALSGVGALLAWWRLLTPAVETVTELALIPMYRVHIHGPGWESIPRRGPLLLVGNHSAYLDPFWLCKMIPRHVTPMMTSLFYDLPVIHWLMVHVVGAIRVPAGGFRREAPELHDAIAELRRGGCVLIFPEGQLRRQEDQPLRLFGQGVWRILHELPQTPVAVCWIEGGWGSFTSYCNGLPMHNKRLDRRRRIDIALERPQVIPPSILADHHATRQYLMRACLECRRYLGLPVLEAQEGHSPGSDVLKVQGADAYPGNS